MLINRIKRKITYLKLLMQKMFIPMVGGYLIFPIKENFGYLKKNQIQKIANFGYLKTIK